MSEQMPKDSIDAQTTYAHQPNQPTKVSIWTKAPERRQTRPALAAQQQPPAPVPFAPAQAITQALVLKGVLP